MTAVWDTENAPLERQGPNITDFFSYGFRPFFLGAAVYAAAFMVVWMAFIASIHTGGDGQWLPVAGSPFAWHAHELAMGFTAAAIAGFLLTAVPNWTGALPLEGWPLAGLFGIWVAGRFAMLFSGLLPTPVYASIDLAFIPALTGVAVRQLLVKPAPRNLVLIVLLGLITVANATYHLGNSSSAPIEPLVPMHTVILCVAVMIAMIGGRIIPAFTHNWLNVRGHKGPMPRRDVQVDTAAVGSVALFAAVEIALPGSWISGACALTGAVINGMRLQGWRGWQTRSEPIVWILHVGYGWMVVGLALSAATTFTGALPPSLAYHAFGIGAAATMILAVMTRAALGHTGRKLVAAPLTVWSYKLITFAAIIRVFAPMLTNNQTMIGIILSIAALAWIAAFALYVMVYAPIMTTPRVRKIQV